MSARIFTPEFKRECAELVVDHGCSFRDAILSRHGGL
ncbi:hypothetical protein KP1_p230 (plasmid) [Klebsiella pneumoniae subsp. pneumoniae NTUH-K2044]|uniref:Transposase n=3 Tax=Enterobacteriaceae TaxID=543 RepID=A0A7D3TNC2_ECOLX|nr:hypothetical protein EBPLCOIM_00245 [Klebsiella pneumoniae subsp. pneumoniae]QGW59751.1 hypothetical protein DEJEEEBI_00203 [Klebsiella pneumoniae]QGW59914.1 hypothetical protein HPPIBGPI_00134 [Escherichia coli]BAH66124.1 hypothetical protein KP1_p230 [Klebsiella pneumoniae subsp. pneumoniae NTUH-K2044]AWM64682.1 hypothetical protein CLEHKFCG_00346 [Klebsiella pneumoniae subsp. pneumoniae]